MAVVKKRKKRRPDVQESAEKAVVEAAPEETVRKLKKKKKKLKVEDVRHEEEAPDEPAQETTEKRKKKKKRKAGGGDTEAGAPAKKSHRKLPEAEAEVADIFSAIPKAAKAAEECTVFVDGVPYVWSVTQVEDHFRKCGEVKEVRAPTWQDSGRLRGFAHVTFADQAARDKALAMDGQKVDKKGRYLKIEPAKAPSTVEAPGAADVEGKRRLFVKNLPYDTTEKAIADLFGKCGKIREVRVPTSFGRCKGFAYVEFARPEHLKAAVEMKPPPSLGGRTLRLDVDTGSGPKAGFHYRPEAFDSGFGPRRGKGDGKGRGKGKDGGKGRGKGPQKLSLF